MVDNCGAAVKSQVDEGRLQDHRDSEIDALAAVTVAHKRNNRVQRRAWGLEIQDRNEQHRLKRQVVIETAARTFNRRGFYKTTLADIAEELHIAKPTIYHYFKNKDEILFECHRIGIEQITGRPLPLGANGAEQLKEFIERYVHMVVSDFGTCLVLTGTTALEPQNRDIVRKGRKEIDTMLREIIARGIKDGSLTSCDPRTTASFIFGQMNWIPYWYHSDGEISVDELAEREVAFVMRALAAGGG
jgi:AcrR family transcriptional regulator